MLRPKSGSTSAQRAFTTAEHWERVLEWRVLGADERVRRVVRREVMHHFKPDHFWVTRRRSDDMERAVSLCVGGVVRRWSRLLSLPLHP